MNKEFTKTKALIIKIQPGTIPITKTKYIAKRTKNIFIN